MDDFETISMPIEFPNKAFLYLKLHEQLMNTDNSFDQKLLTYLQDLYAKNPVPL